MITILHHTGIQDEPLCSVPPPHNRLTHIKAMTYSLEVKNDFSVTIMLFITETFQIHPPKYRTSSINLHYYQIHKRRPTTKPN